MVKEKYVKIMFSYFPFPKKDVTSMITIAVGHIQCLYIVFT